MSEPRNYFSKVREAREALKGKSLDVFDMYMKVAQAAFDTQDFKTAMEALQYLMEHMPNDEGVTMIDSSVNNKKQVEGKKGPQIQIGIALGGMNGTTKVLPQTTTTIIDVNPDSEDE